eukprot:2823638-Rhodomonas_salina.2
MTQAQAEAEQSSMCLSKLEVVTGPCHGHRDSAREPQAASASEPEQGYQYHDHTSLSPGLSLRLGT